MYQLTVGEVSGVIAAIVAVSQIFLPNTLVLILVGLLKDTHSAVTWSVVGNSLANSQWPLLLRSDTTASRNVDVGVRWVTWIRPLGLGLIFIAAIVTPLGLYESLEMDSDSQLVRFEYLADVGPMGYGTPPRSNHRFSRICSTGSLFGLPLQCPGTTSLINYSINAEWMNASFDEIEPRIPNSLVSLYQSGLDAQPQTVSSFFDIQSRQYSYETQDGVLYGKKYLVAAFRPLTMMALDDSVEAVEGLIVDTRKGGVGLRNHTAPTDLRYGAEWHEDIAFLEPDTACVDTNITIEFVAQKGLGTITNYTLVDNGGFVNLNTSYHGGHFWENDNQKNPLLEERAYEAAWLFNVLNMIFMNVTRPPPDRFGYLKSKMGQRFPIYNSLGGYPSYSATLITENFAGLFDVPLAWSNGSLMNNSGSSIYSNPWNISIDDYETITDLCRSSGGGDIANITNINMQCGLVVGAARRTDGVKSLVLEPGTHMVQSMYACASSTKATIKDVHFRFNVSTDIGLKGLQVINVSDKVYPNQSSKPLWGVETPFNYTISELDQLWGLVSESRRSVANLSTVRSERLYLPCAFWNELWTGPGADYMVGTQLPGNAWAGAYSTTGNTLSSGQDYTGSTNVAMFVKWQDLSRATSTTSTMINLIWTDIMASSVVGTRSWISGDTHLWDQKHSKRDGGATSASSALVPVYVYNSRIRYHWVFAIPAFVCIALCTIVLLFAIVLNLKGRGNIARIRHFVFHLSPGRLLGTLVFPEEKVPITSKTEDWIAGIGSNQVQILTGGTHGFAAPSFGSENDHDQKDEYINSSAGDVAQAELGQARHRPDGSSKDDLVTAHPKQGKYETSNIAGETVTEVPSYASTCPSQQGGYVRVARNEDEF